MTVDPSTRFLGLRLPNPLVVRSCPLTGEVYQLQHLEAACAADAVLPSRFEEQMPQDDAQLAGVARRPTVAGDNPDFVAGVDEYSAGPDSCMRHLEAAMTMCFVPETSDMACLSAEQRKFEEKVPQTAGV
jgi:dihydroorotate dehydrogenase (fumarate)